MKRRRSSIALLRRAHISNTFVRRIVTMQLEKITHQITQTLDYQTDNSIVQKRIDESGVPAAAACAHSHGSRCWRQLARGFNSDRITHNLTSLLELLACQRCRREGVCCRVAGSAESVHQWRLRYLALPFRIMSLPHMRCEFTRSRQSSLGGIIEDD